MRIQANESGADRLIRIVLGIILTSLALAGVLGGSLATGAWLVAAILLVTGVTGFCPLYAILRISTRSRAR